MAYLKAAGLHLNLPSLKPALVTHSKYSSTRRLLAFDPFEDAFEFRAIEPSGVTHTLLPGLNGLLGKPPFSRGLRLGESKCFAGGFDSLGESSFFGHDGWISVCEKQFSFDGNRASGSAGGRARGFPALFFVGRLQLSYMWSYGQQIMMSPKISQCSRRGWRVANVCCWTRTGNCWIARLSCRSGSHLSRGFSLTRSARSQSRRSCRKAPRGLSRRAVTTVSQATTVLVALAMLMFTATTLPAQGLAPTQLQEFSAEVQRAGGFETYRLPVITCTLGLK